MIHILFSCFSPTQNRFQCILGKIYNASGHSVDDYTPVECFANLLFHVVRGQIEDRNFVDRSLVSSLSAKKVYSYQTVELPDEH